MNADAVRAFESVCGPWYPGDRPEDIVADIRACDPMARVTVADAVAYLGPAGAVERRKAPAATDDLSALRDRLRS